jgi:hypothetical protein
MAYTTNTSRLCCADADVTTPADFSEKVGYVVKNEAGDFASLCLTNTTADDRPLGVVISSPETTAADIAADNFKRCTVCENGLVRAFAGVEITVGGANHCEVKCHTDGTVAPVTNTENAAFWVVGYIDADEDAVIAVGDPVQIFVKPYWSAARV